MRFTFRSNKKKRVFVLVCKDKIIVQKIKRHRTYAVANEGLYKVWPDDDVLVMENVDAVLNTTNKPEFDKWCSVLSDLGYYNSYTIMNAKDYGTPQNRRRIFMISTLTLGEFIFPEPCPDGRVLRDVLEENVPEEYFLSEERLKTFRRHKERNDAKGNGFGFRVHDIERETDVVASAISCNADRYYQTWIGIPKSEGRSDADIRITGKLTDMDFNQSGKVYDPNGGAPTIRTPSGGGNMPKIEITGELTDSDFIGSRRVFSEGGISPCIKAEHQGPNSPKVELKVAGKIDSSLDIHTPGRKEKRQNGPRCNDGQNAFTVTAAENNGVVQNENGNLRIRYLTPRECLRLQAFPDDVIDKLLAVESKSQCYKLAGNSIAVCCLKAIFKGIYIDKTFKKNGRQVSLNRWF